MLVIATVQGLVLRWSLSTPSFNLVAEGGIESDRVSEERRVYVAFERIPEIRCATMR